MKPHIPEHLTHLKQPSIPEHLTHPEQPSIPEHITHSKQSSFPCLSPPSSTDLRVSARRGGGNAGSIAAGEVNWAGRRTVLDARSRAKPACFLGGVLRQLRQRLPRPRGHAPHVITGCTCAQRTRHDERDAPPTRRGEDLYVCAPAALGSVRRTLCWGRARAGSRRPGAGHRPRTAGAQIGGGRGSPSRSRPCLTASEVGGRRGTYVYHSHIMYSR